MEHTYRFVVGEAEPEPDPPDWVDGVPPVSDGSVCNFCGDPADWMHRLDREEPSYEAWGKRWMLHGLWPSCDRCEALYQTGDDEALIAIWGFEHWTGQHSIEEDGRKPLRAFRRADRGGRRFDDRGSEKVSE